MKKVTKIIATLFVASLILTSCGGNSKEGEPQDKPHEHVKQPDPNITYSLKEALASDFIKISADGNGTYRNIRLNLENKSDASCKLTLPAGIYFENPDDKAQSLITAKKIEIITLNDKQKFSLDVLSFCTNVQQSVPCLLKKWNHNQNYNGGLDEVIEFYGKYEKGINEWLEKKNKEFSDENKRMLFFQTVIWYHEGAQYQEILAMLKNDVFKNDIEKAKVWLDNIQQDASELAKLIKERDSEKIKTWLKEKILELIPTSEQIDESVDKGKKTLDKFRNRLKPR
jgi:predicted small secreted protein